ncbi:glycosyltransferase [Paenisporosarcina sp. NPDC076898]|uniref:glycosyltransferase n=1 Tax=unclassified Paenisporosarcina TaxID=2642018 RepID=UPI003D0121A0
MKVAILAPSKSIHTHKWALYYKNKGIEVKVYTLPLHYSETNANEVDTEIIGKQLPGKISYFTAVPHLKKKLKEFRPTVLHAHFVSSYGLIGALANYQPLFISVWGKDIFDFPLKNKLNQKLIEFTLSKADQIGSTSHVMAKVTSQYTDKKIEVTPFGVDLNKFYPSSQESSTKITIGTVKALEDKYGIGDLINAFHLFHKEFPDSKLVIAGDGPQKEEYIQLAKKLEIADATTFTGRVPNDEVPNLIREFSIFAVPSTQDSESFGVAAVESMACGVPVVVSNVGGLPEVVVDGVTGIVVEKNNPQMLAKAFCDLAASPELRESIGASGVLHVKKHYNWTDNADDMIKLYNKYTEKR